MATFFRSLTRAGPSRPSTILTRNFTAPTFPAFSPSTSSSSPNSSTSPFRPHEKNPYSLQSSKLNPLTGPITPPESQEIKLPPAATGVERDDSDKWWAQQSARRSVLPGNQFSGRSLRVYMNDTMKAYKQLSGILARSGVKKHVRTGEFYEKPSERKRRLGTERHRRRFQEMVREKVQTVQMIRNRG